MSCGEEATVRLVDVHKTYRSGPVVLAGVSVALEPGVPFVLGGANGSGKSTLLRIAAGADTPSSGTVAGRPDVVGYLPDRFPALLRLPARRYLRHLAAVHGADVDAAEETADAVLDELGFTGEDDEPMAELSKGNAQKVGLAQALSCDAGLLVLDEPWSGLDDVAAAALTARLAGFGELLLVTDHTGTAELLPGARPGRIDSRGRLGAATAAAPAVPAVPAASAPSRSAPPAVSGPPAVRIELVCGGDPRRMLDRLPRVLTADVGPGRMTVRVDPPAGDAWIAAALEAGCSVRSVVREGR